MLVALFKDDVSNGGDGSGSVGGGASGNNSSSMIQIMTYLKNKYPKNGINYIMLNGSFSRGLALDRASRSNYVSANDILFFIDVDIVFNIDTIERVRRNTIKHKQVYLPIVFSEYDPAKRKYHNKADNFYGQGSGSIPGSGGRAFTTNSYLADYQRSYLNDYKPRLAVTNNISNERGYFRQFGYGIVSIFRSDALNSEINGFNTDIVGWGLEDVKFLEKIIAANLKYDQNLLDIADGKTSDSDEVPYLKLIRVPDPSLVHVYHPIVCDKNLESAQYKMCLGTKANTLGSYSNVVNMFCRNSNDILDYVRTVANQQPRNDRVLRSL